MNGVSPLDALPKKCFISHSYGDREACGRLLRTLPMDVAPVVFEPISVAPEEFVSDRLINAILGCDGLIFLRGGHSDESFWVAFERDYALRAKKKVFAADAVSLSITRDGEPALDLAAFASYHHGDDAQVRKISDHLRRERYFDLWIDREELAGGDNWQEALTAALRKQLRRGGYVIVFWSSRSSESLGVRDEIQLTLAEHPGADTRVLFALLDASPIPASLAAFQPVQLFGDAERSATNRLDDLVVRLYWLIYKNSKARA